MTRDPLAFVEETYLRLMLRNLREAELAIACANLTLKQLTKADAK